MKKEYKELKVINVPASGERGMMGGAYTLAFLYTKYHGNLLIKGYMREVKEYVKKHYTHYFVNYTLWSNECNRNIWYFWKDEYHICEPDRHKSKYHKTNYKWRFTDFKENGVNIQFRRFPKRWIKEFDNLK